MGMTNDFYIVTPAQFDTNFYNPYVEKWDERKLGEQLNIRGPWQKRIKENLTFNKAFNLDEYMRVRFLVFSRGYAYMALAVDMLNQLKMDHTCLVNGTLLEKLDEDIGEFHDLSDQESWLKPHDEGEEPRIITQLKGIIELLEKEITNAGDDGSKLLVVYCNI